MIEKKLTLPCGHTLEIEERIPGFTGFTSVTISVKYSPGALGIKIRPDGLSATMLVLNSNLPVLRDLLIELAPLPTFKQKFLNFLKGGKS